MSGGAPSSDGEISGRDVVGPAKLSTVPTRGADGVWVRRDGVACLGTPRGCTCPVLCVMHRVLGSEPWSSGAILSTDLARGADGLRSRRDGATCFGAPRVLLLPRISRDAPHAGTRTVDRRSPNLLRKTL